MLCCFDSGQRAEFGNGWPNKRQSCPEFSTKGFLFPFSGFGVKFRAWNTCIWTLHETSPWTPIIHITSQQDFREKRKMRNHRKSAKARWNLNECHESFDGQLKHVCCWFYLAVRAVCVLASKYFLRLITVSAVSLVFSQGLMRLIRHLGRYKMDFFGELQMPWQSVSLKRCCV